MNDMRVGGLASGMNTDEIIDKLMKAERIPLDKMEQDKKWMTWQRDSYRDVNKQLLELDNMMLDMKLERTYNTKTTSSPSSAISATATASAGNGNYNVQVKELASAAYNLSETSLSNDPNDKIDPTKPLSSQAGKFANAIETGTITIETYGEDGPTSLNVDVTMDKSLNDILGEINDSDVGVRAFYDQSADKVMIERTETGNFNTDDSRFLGAEIGFNGSTAGFLSNTLGLKNGDNSSGTWKLNEKGGTDATFVYNHDLEIKTHDNHYSINGVDFQFNSVMDSPVNVNVSNDVDAAVDSITKFVDKYNKIIEDLNGKIDEKRYRDYQPLTDKQKEDMEDKEIELWNDKAKSGLLKSDGVIRNGLFEMRQNWYGKVETGGEYTQLSQIGIETSANYLDKGKLLINEEDLREALRNDPDAVHKLFASDGEGANQQGIVRKLEESIATTMKNIEQKAGKASSTEETYMLGRQLKDMDDRIDQFEDRLTDIEDRYWSQFGAMEKAIQKLNSQSSYLMQNFSQ
ncbi:flagellar hook-associated protein 2 [Halobacillus salinarum]|uniref:Flagellar hook-associated protein 2 n=1 Tax=Halobacillus salinarum TaxID=2932257 RepID=A0ABY4ENK9_9BACI|nr:flagellar hook-associated protein 2 [Halobacillus salinarum]UOQ45733.1 flagellar hook-associated protein 2 [Halobacillus salinarum]